MLYWHVFSCVSKDETALEDVRGHLKSDVHKENVALWHCGFFQFMG